MMRLNPSLTSRLRIGFVVLFALLLIVSLFGVGRLFQIRVNYEDDVSRNYQLEVETERLRSAFILEQAAVRVPSARQTPDRADFNQAARTFDDTAARAADLVDDDTVLATRLQELTSNEAAWQRQVAVPLLRGRPPPPGAEQKLTADVSKSTESLAVQRGERATTPATMREPTPATPRSWLPPGWPVGCSPP